MKIVLVTGGFDPLHAGHMAFFRAAKALGDLLIVGLNSDAWLCRTRGRVILPMSHRMEVIKNLAMVDAVLIYDDTDGSSVDAIRLVQQHYPGAQVIFANGGGRTAANTPEMVFDDVEYVFGIGGDGDFCAVDQAVQQKTDRVWGSYRTLEDVSPRIKIRQVTISPGACLTMQRHHNRSELWLVTQGRGAVYTLDPASERFDQSPVSLKCYLGVYDPLVILAGQWHQLSNETGEILQLIEIQYGSECVEDDIQRLH